MFSHLRWNLRLEVIVLLIACILRFHNATSAVVMENKESVGRNRANSMHSVNAVSISECPPLPGIEGGGYECDNGYKLGSMCTFQCRVGYRIVDECISHNKCIDDGDGDLMWQMTWAQCERICEPLPTIPHGKADKVEARNGEYVTYTCNSGFYPGLNSAMTQQCKNGKIDVTKLSCVNVCYPPTAVTVTPKKSKYALGDTVVFSCNHAYIPSGTTKYTCLKGKFSPSIDFKCNKNCTVVSLTKGEVTNGKTVGDNVRHGTIVKYECIKAHKASSGPYWTKCRDGSWTPKISSLMSCNAPCLAPKIANLKSPSAGYYHDHDLKKNVTFTCVSTRAPRSSDVLQRKCDNGTWVPSFTSSNIVCQQKCTVPTLKDGSATPAAGRTVNHGDKVNFTCDSDFSSPDVLMRTCDQGKFTPAITSDPSDPKCYSDCMVPTIANLTTPASGSMVKHRAAVYTFACSTGFKAGSGQALTRTCTDGVWSPIFDTRSGLVCEPMCLVNVLTNGAATPAVGKYVEDGNPVTYRCNVGFSTSHTLVRSCSAGKWNPLITADNLKCFADCSTIPNVTNAKPSTGSAVSHGEQVTWTCNTPQYMQGVGATMSNACNDGTITTTGVMCFSKCRGEEVANANPVKGTWFEHGSTTTYACNANTDLQSGTVSRRCTDGVLSPSIKSDRIICKRRCTVMSAANARIANGKTVGKAVVHGTSVVYKCNNNHSPIGDLTQICIDGSFSIPFLACKRQPPYDLRVTAKIGTFNESRQMCLEMRGDLIQHSLIKNQTYIDAFNAFTTKTKEWLWIGVTDRQTEGTFKYLNGELFPNATTSLLAYWNTNQPDNGGDENCVVVYQNPRVMNDLECTKLKYGICEIFNDPTDP